MRSLEFDIAAFEDLAWWVKQDRKKALRLIRLIQETQEKPTENSDETKATTQDIRKNPEKQ